MAVRTRILLRPAAGPRLGYGHLVRARTLARVLRADVWVSVRGGPAAVALANAFGLRVVPSSVHAALDEVRPSALVVDDPGQAQALLALRLARARRVPVASIHDLGLAPIDSDLAVDGSVRPVIRRRGGPDVVLLGPTYAVLDRAIAAGHARRGTGPRVSSILVALGGGPRRTVAAAVAEAIGRRLPEAEVRIAGGFAAAASRPRGNVHWIGPRATLVPDLLACDLAVVAGGMTLYEACALGTPAVAVAVVPGQLPAVEGFGTEHAAVSGGLVRPGARGQRSVARVANQVVRLARDGARRRAIARRGARLVDGLGAWRVAAAIERLARSARQ